MLPLVTVYRAKSPNVIRKRVAKGSASDLVVFVVGFYMFATKVFNEITSAGTTDTDTGIPSQCCEISNEDQNHIAPVSKPASGGEKQIDTSSSCNDQSHRIMQEYMKLDLKLEEETSKADE
ncbi:uncharacterized protein LOC127130858 [Lathyrus oleraceus]|uniref:uncharacterized protein LOC127130858 n=1 Tax=Pisum sativum TaxID=3888 RepID=UPI0021CECEE1|nr:uncharacterized protein LOC127130858 [Pisum sativum]